MRILQGLPASPGVAIGEALIIDDEGFRIPRRYIQSDGVAEELHRLEKAVDAVGREIQRNSTDVTQQLGEQYGAIFAAHLQLLRDPSLQSELTAHIRDEHYTSEYAVRTTLHRYANAFRQLGNAYLAERAHDILDIERSLLRQLLGESRRELSRLASPAILLAHDLTPSETASLRRGAVLGFATEMGGANSHTAIVAKGLEIPAVVGLGDFLTELAEGDPLIVDGDHGRVILNPDEETLSQYRHEVEQHRSRVVQLGALRDLPAQTADGVGIELHANIEFPRDVQTCLERGASGIGLYRTEFLYLGAESEPTEEDHFQAYAEVVRAMSPKPVVIRTLDLGADKMGRVALAEPERNPFLGVRSIRLSLRNVSLFRTQLRAILRASALGDVHVMFPLISNLPELLQAKMVLADAMEDLDERGVAFNRRLPVGIMVEVPSAVITLDKFLPEVDFISVGTNDLIQYALAVDRCNSQISDAYQAGDPAVLRLLETTLRTARAGQVPASICGQMSGEVTYTMLLLGLGARVLSVPPSSIPEIKKVCRSVTMVHCEEVAQRALTLDSAQEVDRYLREVVRQVVPELVAA